LPHSGEKGKGKAMAMDEDFVRETLRLAAEGMERGEGGPFGALVTRGNEVLGRGWNRVLATNDPTAHAEVVALREACAHAGSYWLPDCTLYSSCEPCPMWVRGAGPLAQICGTAERLQVTEYAGLSPTR